MRKILKRTLFSVPGGLQWKTRTVLLFAKATGLSLENSNDWECWTIVDMATYECQSSGYITSSNSNVTNRCGIQFSCVHWHNGVASTDCEFSYFWRIENVIRSLKINRRRFLTNHDECDFHPQHLVVSLENCREEAGHAAGQERRAEQPLFARLHDDVHGDADCRNLD